MRILLNLILRDDIGKELAISIRLHINEKQRRRSTTRNDEQNGNGDSFIVPKVVLSRFGRERTMSSAELKYSYGQGRTW